MTISVRSGSSIKLRGKLPSHFGGRASARQDSQSGAGSGLSVPLDRCGRGFRINFHPADWIADGGGRGAHRRNLPRAV